MLQKREEIECARPLHVCCLRTEGVVGGLEGEQGVHEASLPYQRHARLSVLMVITLATIGARCSGSQQGRGRGPGGEG